MKYQDLKSELHAFLIIVGGMASLILTSVVPLLVAGIIAFGFMWWTRAPVSSRKGTSIGVANSITLGRLCFLIVCTLLYQYMDPVLYGGSVLLVIIADAIDGYYARKYNEETAFGAEFDMEVDALLAAILTTVIYLHYDIGPWVLVAGFLRYIFVIIVRIFGLHKVELPHMPGVKLLAVLFFISLLLPFVFPLVYATWGLMLGAVIIYFSFAREFVLILKVKLANG